MLLRRAPRPRPRAPSCSVDPDEWRFPSRRTPSRATRHAVVVARSRRGTSWRRTSRRRPCSSREVLERDGCAVAADGSVKSGADAPIFRSAARAPARRSAGTGRRRRRAELLHDRTSTSLAKASSDAAARRDSGRSIAGAPLTVTRRGGPGRRGRGARPRRRAGARRPRGCARARAGARRARGPRTPRRAQPRRPRAASRRSRRRRGRRPIAPRRARPRGRPSETSCAEESMPSRDDLDEEVHERARTDARSSDGHGPSSRPRTVARYSPAPISSRVVAEERDDVALAARSGSRPRARRPRGGPPSRRSASGGSRRRPSRCRARRCPRRPASRTRGRPPRGRGSRRRTGPRISGRSGLPKFRQSVTASGRAPTQARLSAASATAWAAPRLGIGGDVARVDVASSAARPFAVPGHAEDGRVAAGPRDRVRPHAQSYCVARSSACCRGSATRGASRSAASSVGRAVERDRRRRRAAASAACRGAGRPAPPRRAAPIARSAATSPFHRRRHPRLGLHDADRLDVDAPLAEDVGDLVLAAPAARRGPSAPATRRA